MATLISIVVAADERNAIGRQGGLPWHLPNDLKHFKALTLGKPILMGRKTWNSIGRPLPGRRSIIITRQPGLVIEAATVVSSLDQALAAAGDVPEACVIGGADIFSLALPRTDIVHLTRVHGNVVGDVRWEPLDERLWRRTAREEHGADERHAYAMTFEVWEKR